MKMKYIKQIIGVILITFGLSSCQKDNVAPTPDIAEVFPSEGLPGTLVTIKGSGLADMQKVYFGETNARFNPVYNTNDVLMVRVPAEVKYGMQKLILINSGGDATKRETNFKVLQPPPVIDAFEPTEGAAGDIITLKGKIFMNVIEVRFGGKSAEIVSKSETEIKVKVPEGVEKAPIEVVTEGGAGLSKIDFSPKGVGYFLYDDQLQNGYQNWSWAKVTLADQTKVKSGRNAIKVVFSAWGALWLNNPNSVKASDFKTLKFWVYGGEDNDKKIKVFYRAKDDGSPSGNTGVTLTIKAKVWTEVVLNVSDLGNEADLKGILFQEFGNEGDQIDPVYFDDIRLQ